MDDLLQACLTGGFIGAFLGGRIKAGGNLLALWKLIAVLNAARA